MVDLINRFTDEPPAESGDVVKIGSAFFEVEEVEPMYYRFSPPGGFTTLTYAVEELIPSPNYVHYVVSIGADCPIEFAVKYPSGRPRQTPNAASVQRLPSSVANYLSPWTFKFAILKGDTLELDVDTGGVVVVGGIWFYGWKWRVKEPSVTPTSGYKVPLDVRRSN